jgi:hypothetical protein
MADTGSLYAADDSSDRYHHQTSGEVQRLEKDYVAIADLNKRAIALRFTKPFQKAYPSRVTFILARSPAPKKRSRG